jgi:hypothetical protein
MRPTGSLSLASESSVRSVLERGVLALIVCGVVISGLYLARPDVLGLYHDDGIYVATAKSLAEDGEYRLINVPTAPYETKYPPLYPAILAVVWKFAPQFPANIRALKGVNTLLLGLICVLTWRLASRLGPGHMSARIGATLCIATSPWFLILADLAVSDALFTAAFIVFLLAVPTESDRLPRRRLVLASVAVALGSVTRAIGSVLWVPLTFSVWRRRDGIAAAAAITCFAVSTGAWTLWRRLHHLTNPGLLGYYVGYEVNVLDWLRSDPSLAGRVFFENVVEYCRAIWYVAGVTSAGLAVVCTALCGVAALDRKWPFEVVLTCFVYVIAISIHPLPLARYLLPLVPILLVAVSHGASLMASELLRRWPRSRGLVPAVSTLPLLWILGTNARAIAADAPVGVNRTRIDSLAPSPLSYAAFPETVQWLITHKSAADVVAARHDPFYFLFAGITGVRPWVPHPEIYSDQYGRRWSSTGSTDFDQSELDRLGVTILVSDQGLPGAEERYVSAHLGRLLTEHSEAWRLEYVTHDLKHRIYRRVRNSVGNLTR